MPIRLTQTVKILLITCFIVFVLQQTGDQFFGAGLFLLFWWIQFYGVTQLEQGKALFERFSYEITGQQIVMKFNPREGMPMKWD